MAILAFSAGIFTFVAPCAFLLPAYISYYFRSKTGIKNHSSGNPHIGVILRESLSSGIIISSAILSIFTLIGIFVSFIGDVVKPYIPASQVFVGLVMIIMGTVMLFNVQLPLHPKIAPSLKGRRGLFSFGILYGLAIVGCSAPIFISLLTYAAFTEGMLDSVLIFWLYSLGVSIPLIGVTLLVAGARDTAIHRITQWMPAMRRIASLTIIIVGMYLIYRYIKLFYLL